MRELEFFKTFKEIFLNIQLKTTVSIYIGKYEATNCYWSQINEGCALPLACMIVKFKIYFYTLREWDFTQFS